MNEVLPTYEQTMSEDTTSATSSPASEAGQSRSVSPNGPTTERSGQAAAPVSRSRRRVSKLESRILGTCGPSGSNSSASASLQSYLENRLLQQLKAAGSTLFTLTWKAKDTPAGRPYCQLVASARRTSDNDFGSWHSPTTENRIGNEETAMRHPRNMERLDGQVFLAQAGDAGRQLPAVALGGVASQSPQSYAGNLASWPTPRSEDGGMRHSRGVADTLTAVSGLAAPWSTPRANKWGFPDAHGSQEKPLASWATPTNRDYKDGASTLKNTPVNALLGRQVLGAISNGSPAQTEKPGQLNPAFSAWLMGYSAAHLSCAPTAMPSSRRLPRNLSKPVVEKCD